MQLATRTGLIHEKRWFKHENGGLTMKNGGLSWFIHENGGLTMNNDDLTTKNGGWSMKLVV